VPVTGDDPALTAPEQPADAPQRQVAVEPEPEPLGMDSALAVLDTPLFTQLLKIDAPHGARPPTPLRADTRHDAKRPGGTGERPATLRHRGPGAQPEPVIPVVSGEQAGPGEWSGSVVQAGPGVQPGPGARLEPQERPVAQQVGDRSARSQPAVVAQSGAEPRPWPTTEPPAADPPAADPPAADPPAAERSVGDPPAAEPPITEGPASEQPTAERSAAEPPVTGPPAFERSTAEPEPGPPAIGPPAFERPTAEPEPGPPAIGPPAFEGSDEHPATLPTVDEHPATSHGHEGDDGPDGGNGSRAAQWPTDQEPQLPPPYAAGAP
jgi:hypothetical protein